MHASVKKSSMSVGLIVAVAVLVTGFVLFTLFFQATTIRQLMDWLGLSELTPRDRAIRDRVLTQTLTHVTESAAQAIDRQDVDSELAAGLFEDYRLRVAAANEKNHDVSRWHEKHHLAIGDPHTWSDP